MTAPAPVTITTNPATGPSPAALSRAIRMLMAYAAKQEEAAQAAAEQQQEQEEKA